MVITIIKHRISFNYLINIKKLDNDNIETNSFKLLFTLLGFFYCINNFVKFKYNPMVYCMRLYPDAKNIDWINLITIAKKCWKTVLSIFQCDNLFCQLKNKLVVKMPKETLLFNVKNTLDMNIEQQRRTFFKKNGF